MNLDLSIFPHIYKLQVRSYELDFQGVVNNATYFNYLEIARIDYNKAILKFQGNNSSLLKHINYFVVHNECDYFQPAKFGDDLTIYSRIDYIKRTSFCFEQLIISSKDELIAKAKGVIVAIDPQNNNPTPISEEFKDSVKKYDSSVKIISE